MLRHNRDLALVVAVAVLVFTIGSFWWLNARWGKLQIVGEPRSYSFAATDGLILNLPLVFANARPGAAVAVNLRLRLNAAGFPSVVPFMATHEGVKPENESRKMATSIVIQGRETRLVCCEFIARREGHRADRHSGNRWVRLERLVEVASSGLAIAIDISAAALSQSRATAGPVPHV